MEKFSRVQSSNVSSDFRLRDIEQYWFELTSYDLEQALDYHNKLQSTQKPARLKKPTPELKTS